MQNQSEKTLSKVEVPLITTNQPKAREEFKDRPTNVRCPSCGKNISTQLEYHNGLLTYAACIGIFLFGGACGCCLIPFCVKACKDVDHKCPSCHRYIGSYHRIGD